MIETLLDPSANGRQRAAAARRLGASSSKAALGALVVVARDPEAKESVARAAGEAVARVLLQRDEVDTVPLEDFTGPAFPAYDAAVAEHLRGARASK